MADEISSLPGAAAVRPTDREMPRRDQRGAAQRRAPGPKKPEPDEPVPPPDESEPRQVGTKLDVRG